MVVDGLGSRFWLNDPDGRLGCSQQNPSRETLKGEGLLTSALMCPSAVMKFCCCQSQVHMVA